jgi:group II intron reverse transcriptase/maturase
MVIRQTSLRGIANKAAVQKTYRFRSLARLLTVDFLLFNWGSINKKAASGIDNVSAREYEENLQENIENLVDCLKGNRYKAKLVQRHYIPKANGKMRPLGIPAIDDKVLQTGVKAILEAIYEQDFLPCSYGYRPHRGAKDAIKDLYQELSRGKYNYIVEADIKGYFDNIDHTHLLNMLALRIDDKRFLGLIRKWLKAGILDIDGQIIHPETGTPQGGIVSPVLANVYLHYALDLWFESVVKPHCRGAAYLCRYADDFICAFQFESDAKTFYRELGQRLGQLNLQLAEDKTRTIKFSRFQGKEKTYFEFLGFEFRWGKSRAGKTTLKTRTGKKKLRSSIKDFAKWCKENRHKKVSIIFKEVNSKLRGYYNYYGVSGNSESLNTYFYYAKCNLFKWLNRRSQRRSYNWQGFNELIKYLRLEKPRIIVKPTQLVLCF